MVDPLNTQGDLDVVKKKAAKKAPPAKAAQKKAMKKAALAPTTADLKKAGQLTRALAGQLELALKAPAIQEDFGGTCWIKHPDVLLEEPVNVSKATCARIHGRWQPN